MFLKSLSFSVATLLDLISSAYVEYDNYHYIAVWNDANVISWETANAYCNDSMGTELASIHNATQNVWALDAAVGTGANISESSSIEGQDQAWVGLNDKNTEGSFEWTDGTAFDYTNWGPSQPAASGAGQDCVVLYSGGLWNDKVCSANTNSETTFVCNRPYVPPPGDCTAQWLENGNIEFYWGNATLPDGADSSDYEYWFGYWVAGDLQYFTLNYLVTSKLVSDFDKGTTAEIPFYAGTVQLMDLRWPEIRYSQIVNCTSVTAAPYPQPTKQPTAEPTGRPSLAPTPAPTWSDPYLFIGGNICLKDRCDCNAFDITCVKDDVYTSWDTDSQNTVIFEQRTIGFGYDTLLYWKVDYMGATNDTDNITLSNVVSDAATTIEFTPDSGYVNASLNDDNTDNDARVTISVDHDSVLAETLNTPYVAYLYRLTLVNCSVFNTYAYGSKSYDECDIVYPSELYIRIDTSSDGTDVTNITEKEDTSWLLWVIIAAVAFTIILAFLIYRFWWKNRVSKKELAKTEEDRDQAIEEIENGWAGPIDSNNVQFNPMSTAARQSGLVNGKSVLPESGQSSNVMTDRADVTIEKFNQKSEFGQVAPKRPNY